MSDPVIVDWPNYFREPWGLFAQAVCEKPEHFAEAFGVLLKYAEKDAIRLLVDAAPDDIATTILAYLPEQAQEKVTALLANDPALVERIREEIRGCQSSLRDACREVVASGKYQAELKAVV